MHRARSGFVKSRTAQTNQIRGLLSEFGIVLRQGIAHVANRLPNIIEDAEDGFSVVFRELLIRVRSYLLEINRQIEALKKLDRYLAQKQY
jgi:transposase